LTAWLLLSLLSQDSLQRVKSLLDVATKIVNELATSCGCKMTEIVVRSGVVIISHLLRQELKKNENLFLIVLMSYIPM
jgi:hypothetical protein